jgi:hypothetical protein
LIFRTSPHGVSALFFAPDARRVAWLFLPCEAMTRKNLLAEMRRMGELSYETKTFKQVEKEEMSHAGLRVRMQKVRP